MHTVKMTAPAMRSLMGDNFNEAEFEKGQQDARERIAENPQALADSLDEIQRVLSSGCYKNRPGPSYWLGCLNILDFMV